MTTPQIELREPPPRVTSGRRPIMDLDRAILAISVEPMRPVAIARKLRELPAPPGVLPKWSGITSQRVASRLKALVTRELAVRVRPVGAPANGPGTSLYRARREGEQLSDG